MSHGPNFPDATQRFQEKKVKRPGGALIGEGMLNEEQQQELQQELEQQQQLQQLQLRQQQLQEQQLRQQQQQQQEREQQLQQLQQQQLEKYQQRHAHTNSNDSFTSWAFVKDGGVKSIVNLAELDSLTAEEPKDLCNCSGLEVLFDGGTIGGSADLCLHPIEHADSLLWAQEAEGPRHGIRTFQDASRGGRRHALALPVNAVVKGLNQMSMNNPLLEGWMGISPAELARYMLWSGYDSLLLQQVPVVQATAGLGRWKTLENFIEAFSKAWEKEIGSLLEDSERSREHAREEAEGVLGENAAQGSRERISEGPKTFNIGDSSLQPPGVTNAMMDGLSNVGDVRKGGGGGGGMPNIEAIEHAIRAGADMEGATRGQPGFWPAFIRVHTASVLVENGDAFVHHGFMSRQVEKPWWYSLKGVILRNRHLDVKGLFSHSYASEVYKSRTQLVTFIENYVEEDGADGLEDLFKSKKSLWGISPGASLNVKRGRRLSMFAVEEVDASVTIDPIDPPSAFTRVVVGEEFSEADSLLPRPFSSVDIGHFLTVMQTKSIPALVCFSLPPSLSELKVFRDRQEPISMVQYLSHPVFADFEPNMPRVARAKKDVDAGKSILARSASAVDFADARKKGVRWADQQPLKKKASGVDALACPNLFAFLDAVTAERKRTGAAAWSGEGDEEADWIEAVVEQLRTAKRVASKATKAQAAATAAAAAAASASASASAAASAAAAGNNNTDNGINALQGSSSAPAANAESSVEVSRVGGAGEGNGEGEEDGGDGLREVPEWIVQQLPDLLRLLEACRLLVHDPTLLQTMMEASERAARRRKRGGAYTPGAVTPSRSQPNTPNRTPSRVAITPSRIGTPSSAAGGGRGGGFRTPGGREIEEDQDELMRTFEEEALPLHWVDVERLGNSDTLQDPEDGPELLEDQLLSAYLEYSVGQPRLGTRSSVRAHEVVLDNVQFLIDSGSLTPLHYETSQCGPVKSDLFKSILGKMSALANMLQSSSSKRKGSKGVKGASDGTDDEKEKVDKNSKEQKDIKAAVHGLLAWVRLDQVHSCIAALSLAGGADRPSLSQHPADLTPPTYAEVGSNSIRVYVVEKQVMTFTGAAESEEHYAFHAAYKETNKGLDVYITKEHKNQAAGVLWCFLKALGVPVMVCHLAECLMDRTLDCRWEATESNGENFKSAGSREGAAGLGYVGDLRPLKFISETCQFDIQYGMPILERACFLRMLAHGHACLAEYSAAGASKARSRSELAASFRMVSTWRQAIVQNLRSMPSNRYLRKFEEHLRLPHLSIIGTVIGHKGVDPRRVLWWTWIAVPWSPSARAAITNLLTVIGRAPPPRPPASAAPAETTSVTKNAKRKAAASLAMQAPGSAALVGQQEHGALWRMASELFVTRLGTCMLVRSLVLENRDESPYPPNERHYHMVALELRGADKTAVFEYLRTDPGMLGEVLNRLVREDCLAADHSAAFLDSKSLGTLHNVKHGKSKNEPMWLETGYGGRLKRFRETLMGPKDSSVVHGYSVGMYYSMPVLIELLIQLTSGGSSSIYTTSSIGEFESVVPVALLHSLVIFGGLSLGAAKISSVNYFSFMMIKLVLAQIQFVSVLVVASVVMLPFVVGIGLLLWWDTPLMAATFVGVFFFVGLYIMLVSLMLSTTGGKPWSSNSGRTMLLAHALLLISPLLSSVGIIPSDYTSIAFLGGVIMLMVVLMAGFTVNTRRIYNMTMSSQPLTLSNEEWKEWRESHSDHPDPVALFYQRSSSMFSAWRHKLTRKRRYQMLDEDLEQYLLGFDAIRSAQAVPERWCKDWDDRLKRGHEALVAVNRGAGVETASTMWAVVKWDVFYGAAYFMMVFSDNLVSIWTEKKIVASDDISSLALALFIVATAGLESMMMVNLGRSNGWRFWRIDPEVLSMSDASRAVSNALHKLYLWDFATYSCFVLMCTLMVSCLGYFWLIGDDFDWAVNPLLRAISLVVGYMGILVGLFHKILFGGSVSRQKASVKVSAAALAAGYGCGLSLVATNWYVNFSHESLAFTALGFTGFFYAVFSMHVYREFRVQLTSQGFASGQLLSTPSLGTAGQRCIGVASLHLDAREARATESCRSASGRLILTQMENRELIRRTLFSNGLDPGSLWVSAPRSLRAAFGNKVPRNDDFFRWTISPVPDRCILDHGLNALVDPEQDGLLYVAESIYADRQSLMECLLHETYEWAYGSHQVGVLAELLLDPLPTRIRRQITSAGNQLPALVDRTLPCCVDAISVGCLKNEMYWKDLSPHARELVLRMVLTQPPLHFKHEEAPINDQSNDQSNDHNYEGGRQGGSYPPQAQGQGQGQGQMFASGTAPATWHHTSFVISEEHPRSAPTAGGGGGALSTRDGAAELNSDLALAMRMGCRNCDVLIAAMEEASLGLEPQVVVARASLLTGLSQCIMRFALAHISANPGGSNLATLRVARDPNTQSRTHRTERQVSMSHLEGRQRVWGVMANAFNDRAFGGARVKKSIRQSNVEALLDEVKTVFPPKGAFHLDYMLFGAASGCMGFDREAFALLLDQNPRSLPVFIKLHRASQWLYKKLLFEMVLKTDPLICELMKAIDSAKIDSSGNMALDESDDKSDLQSSSGPATVHDSADGEMKDPEIGGNWLVEQRRSLEGMIRASDLPIAFSQWLDQRVLRREPLLADYWQARDAGHFSEALVSLKLVETDLQHGLGTGIPAGLSTYADLATFAKCGSTVGMMRAPRHVDDSRQAGVSTFAGTIKGDGGVCVVAMDSGTWPLYGGGVAVCRKQLLDDTVGRVRWNTLFEVALPAPLPTTVDTPENVRQILPVPLWSQNAGGSYETFLAHTSFITRSLRESRTTKSAINAFFVPQLKTLIDLANTPGDSVSVGGLEVAASAIAEIYSYFQVFDWETTWKAGTTHDHWAASWLACAARDKQAGPLLNSEKPNLAELHEILNYWQTLLTCLQVQLPEMNKDNRGVVHVSHHGTQALVGIAAKRLCGWSLVVWDHGMLWRERCKAIAELHSSSLFVRKSLISLHRLVAKVTLYVADTLTPCTQMNKPWELRAVSERDSEVRELVDRKVNPVLNGAPASISPNDFLPGLNADNKNEWVTVVMLSHVYALKGVLTAIQGADLIVHRYGMKKFRLMIYGSTTHDVVYCRRCQDAIERLKLTENVWLKGKGRPAAVLAQGDMFLNSSVSEGLPLAIIEASRAGLVVVATDVGGTRDVVGEFGGICRPNSPLELAKTMLESLAACKKWCKINGAPNLDWGDIDLSTNPRETLEKAIFNEDVINARHDWGARYLEWTGKAFTLDRYRDEHVRALWWADRQAMTNCARLTLDWGPDPGQKRLAVSYLRLRRLLDVSDRKEHTNLSFINSLSEVRARIRSEQENRTPIDLSTDADQLAAMNSFQAMTAELPLLLWLHGGKTDWNEFKAPEAEEGPISQPSPDIIDDGTMSFKSSSTSMQLQRIDESDQESDHQPSHFPQRHPHHARVDSQQETSPSSTTSSAMLGSFLSHRPPPQGIGTGTRYSEDDSSITGRGRNDRSNSGLGPLHKGTEALGSLGPGAGMGVFATDQGLQRVEGGGDSSAAERGTSGENKDDVDNPDIREKLEKLALFEKLDKRLMERAGLHLEDMGDLSSPALKRALRKSADSPGSNNSSNLNQPQRLQQHISPAQSVPSPTVASGESVGYFSDDEESASPAGVSLTNASFPETSLMSLLTRRESQLATAEEAGGVGGTGTGEEASVGPAVTAAKAQKEGGGGGGRENLEMHSSSSGGGGGRGRGEGRGGEGLPSLVAPESSFDGVQPLGVSESPAASSFSPLGPVSIDTILDRRGSGGGGVGSFAVVDGQSWASSPIQARGVAPRSSSLRNRILPLEGGKHHDDGSGNGNGDDGGGSGVFSAGMGLWQEPLSPPQGRNRRRGKGQERGQKYDEGGLDEAASAKHNQRLHTAYIKTMGLPSEDQQPTAAANASNSAGRDVDEVFDEEGGGAPSIWNRVMGEDVDGTGSGVEDSKSSRARSSKEAFNKRSRNTTSLSDISSASLLAFSSTSVSSKKLRESGRKGHGYTNSVGSNKSYGSRRKRSSNKANSTATTTETTTTSNTTTNNDDDDNSSNKKNSGNNGNTTDNNGNAPQAPKRKQPHHTRKGSKIQIVMHPREEEKEDAPRPTETVSVETWKKRARNRQNSIKSLAASRYLAAAAAGSGSERGSVSAPRGEIRQGSPLGHFSDNPFSQHYVAAGIVGNGGANSRSLPGVLVEGVGRGLPPSSGGTAGVVGVAERRSAGGERVSSPETSRPLPHVRDILARQGPTERGIKRFSKAPVDTSDGNIDGRIKVVPRQRVEQAAANFAAEDSAEEDSDEASSVV